MTTLLVIHTSLVGRVPLRLITLARVLKAHRDLCRSKARLKRLMFQGSYAKLFNLNSSQLLLRDRFNVWTFNVAIRPFSIWLKALKPYNITHIAMLYRVVKHLITNKCSTQHSDLLPA